MRVARRLGVGYPDGMGDVTELLGQLNAGDATASDQLLQSVYAELRQMAAFRFSGERAEHTLQPTALVNEAYLRLVSDGRLQHFQSRGHFFAAAAETMRRILVDSARARASQKRGGHLQRVELHDVVHANQRDRDLLLDLDEGLRQLAVEDQPSAELVKLRLFAGLSVTEAGEILGMSRTTAYKTWEFARTWFAVFLGG